ncbi:MAG: hypothetical protein JO029_02815 [Candidatus Eremiobacteraeota bacterium]|nr:hypothetical protein [Candidatus Eremiobacteraeota bacterium]
MIEFGPDANGNVKPIRRFFPFGAAFVYGEDATGNFWSFLTRFSDAAKPLGSVKPFRWVPGTVGAFATDFRQNFYVAQWPGSGFGKPPRTLEIDEFPVNRYGKIPPLRRLIVDPRRGLIHQLAIDGAGNVYALGGSSFLGSQIAEYPAGQNGRVAPSRVLDLPKGYAFFSDVKADAAGNVYALAQGPPKASAVLEYGAAGHDYRTVLSVRTIFPFAVNAAGDLFAVVQWPNWRSRQCVEQIVELAHATNRRVLAIRGTRTVICRHRAASITVPP